MSTLPGWMIGLVAAVFPGFGAAPETGYNGYIEADYIYVAATSAGRLSEIAVREGDKVAPGQPLFRLDEGTYAAALAAAMAQVAAAAANLDNLQTGARPEEIAVLRAALASAEAQRQLAASTLERSERLIASGSATVAQLDAQRAALAAAKAQVAQAEAQLAVAELPARPAQRAAAEAALRAAEAEAERARAALAERVVAAPAAGRVEKLYFDPGEVAGVGAPVLSILPEGPLTVLFFVPESDRPKLAPGATFLLSCDTCPPGLTATLTRLAASPQYTPPVIYSRDERTRLVYRAEAALAAGSGLMPGQPVTLRPWP
ncbi:HlyD family secretion protein [Phaeovulum sp.]|uniref:HlyD family secretion protein n=1 Tax=Phaeovulum sp. TaxID=2934796 RepID=UPI0027302E4A|nr:HlyD family efflux transporter periplasmic adaptor subunit [Phaeovulum sp.]MDP1668640.1 HlyD family efflux transporter periplasmic adaptor subunit [Phaeovulum sp.]MDZ4119872.1 HlyD family efflux transporter periplasmic adaptor subunit [Phaeovulum sp.]